MAMTPIYALRRLRAGDYLWASNDGLTLWRLMRYQDGAAHGLNVDYELRWFWQVFKVTMPKQPVMTDEVDLLPWQCMAELLPTRRAAHEYAMDCQEVARAS